MKRSLCPFPRRLALPAGVESVNSRVAYLSASSSAYLTFRWRGTGVGTGPSSVILISPVPTVSGGAAADPAGRRAAPAPATGAARGATGGAAAAGTGGGAGFAGAALTAYFASASRTSGSSGAASAARRSAASPCSFSPTRMWSTPASRFAAAKVG